MIDADSELKYETRVIDLERREDRLKRSEVRLKRREDRLERREDRLKRREDRLERREDRLERREDRLKSFRKKCQIKNVLVENAFDGKNQENKTQYDIDLTKKNSNITINTDSELKYETHVINLKRREDRLERFMKRCPIKNVLVEIAFDGKNQ